MPARTSSRTRPSSNTKANGTPASRKLNASADRGRRWRFTVVGKIKRDEGVCENDRDYRVEAGLRGVGSVLGPTAALTGDPSAPLAIGGAGSSAFGDAAAASSA